ncbi:hypothetical protein ISF_09844 [Cordyceps fumosorosea ARSEF 2679]|uniref:Uncharacterized protein n=1 Tax=Cordyceps fumosorosea (strain ARSEF 2679) TaxID=1081104 RepID=A0A167B8D7_CORFA|nr:hypothetical protein ISF_09844 [Cordyceps fumosorosea ARSEF 2679]OAA39765.1 hypothetical protein ISF_09844 [Cordyceps fumosorosea ARSEF 2679]
MSGSLLRLTVLYTTVLGFLRLHLAHKHNLAHALNSREIKEILIQSLKHHSINEFLEAFVNIRDNSCPPGKQIDWAIVAHVADYLWLSSVLDGLPSSYPHDKPAWQLVLVVLRRHFPFLDKEQLVPEDVHELIGCVSPQEHLDAASCRNIISRICNGKDSQGRQEVGACNDMIARRGALWSAIVGDDGDEDAIHAQFMGYHERRQDSANDIENDEEYGPNDQLLKELKERAVQTLQEVGNKDLTELRNEALVIVTSAKEIMRQIRGGKAHGSRTPGAQLAVSDEDYQERLQRGRNHIIEQLHKKFGEDEEDQDGDYDPFSQTCPETAPQNLDTDIDESQPEAESETNDREIPYVNQFPVSGNNKISETSFDNRCESTVGGGATTAREENMGEQVATAIEEQTATARGATDEKQAATDGQATTETEAHAEWRAATKEHIAAEQSVTSPYQDATRGQVATEERDPIKGYVFVVSEKSADDEQAAVGNSSRPSSIPNLQSFWGTQRGPTEELSTYGENLDELKAHQEQGAKTDLQLSHVETPVEREDMTDRGTVVDSITEDEIDHVEMADQKTSAGSGLDERRLPGIQGKSELQQQKRKWTADDGNNGQRKRGKVENMTPVPFGDVEPVDLRVEYDMSMAIYRLFPIETAWAMISNCLQLLEERDYVAYYAHLYTTLRDHPNIKEEMMPQSTAAILKKIHERFNMLPNAPNKTQVEDAIRNEEPQFAWLIYDRIGPSLVAQRDSFQLWKNMLQDRDQLLRLQTICLRLYNLVAPGQITDAQSFDAMAFEKSMMATLKQSSCALMMIRIVKSGMVRCGVDFQDCNPVTEEEFQALFSRMHVAFAKLKKQKCSGGTCMAKGVLAATDRAQRRSRPTLTATWQRKLTLKAPAVIKTYVYAQTIATEAEKQPQADVEKQPKTQTDRVVKAATAAPASYKSPSLLEIKKEFFIRSSLKPSNALRDSQREKHLQLAKRLASVDEGTGKNMQECLDKSDRAEEYYLLLLSLVRTRKIPLHILPDSARHILSPVLNDDLGTTVQVDGASESQLSRWFLLLRPWRPSRHYRETGKEWAEMLNQYGSFETVEFRAAFEIVLADFRATIHREVGELLKYESRCLEIAILRNKIGNRVVRETSLQHGHKSSPPSASLNGAVGHMMTESSPIFDKNSAERQVFESEAVEAAASILNTPAFQDSPKSMEGILFSYNYRKAKVVSEVQTGACCSDNATRGEGSLQNDGTAEIGVECGDSKAARTRSIFLDMATQMGGNPASGNHAQRDAMPGAHESVQTEVFNSDTTTQMERPPMSRTTAPTETQTKSVPGTHQAMQTDTFYSDSGTQVNITSTSDHETQTKTIRGTHQAMQTDTFYSDSGTQMNNTSTPTCNHETQTKTIRGTHQAMQTDTFYSDSGTQMNNTSTPTCNHETQTKTIRGTHQAMQTDTFYSDSGTQMNNTSTPTCNHETQTKTIRGTHQAMQTDTFYSDSGTQMNNTSTPTCNHETQTKTIRGTHQAMQTDTFYSDSGTQMNNTSTPTCNHETQTKTIRGTHQAMQTDTFYSDSGTQMNNTSTPTCNHETQTKTIRGTHQAMQTDTFYSDSGTQMNNTSTPTCNHETQTKTIRGTHQAMQTDTFYSDSGTQMNNTSTPTCNHETQTKTIRGTHQAMQTDTFYSDSGTQMNNTSTPTCNHETQTKTIRGTHQAMQTDTFYSDSGTQMNNTSTPTCNHETQTKTIRGTHQAMQTDTFYSDSGTQMNNTSTPTCNHETQTKTIRGTHQAMQTDTFYSDSGTQMNNTSTPTCNHETQTKTIRGTHQAMQTDTFYSDSGTQMNNTSTPTCNHETQTKTIRGTHQAMQTDTFYSDSGTQMNNTSTPTCNHETQTKTIRGTHQAMQTDTFYSDSGTQMNNTSTPTCNHETQTKTIRGTHQAMQTDTFYSDSGTQMNNTSTPTCNHETQTKTIRGTHQAMQTDTFYSDSGTQMNNTSTPTCNHETQTKTIRGTHQAMQTDTFYSDSGTQMNNTSTPTCNHETQTKTIRGTHQAMQTDTFYSDSGTQMNNTSTPTCNHETQTKTIRGTHQAMQTDTFYSDSGTQMNNTSTPTCNHETQTKTIRGTHQAMQTDTFYSDSGTQMNNTSTPTCNHETQTKTIRGTHQAMQTDTFYSDSGTQMNNTSTPNRAMLCHQFVVQRGKGSA